MTKEELLKHWAEEIIPCVFRAEDEVTRKHPEWKERLKNVTDENRKAVADEYCRAIAGEILANYEEGGEE